MCIYKHICKNFYNNISGVLTLYTYNICTEPKNVPWDNPRVGLNCPLVN